MPSGSPQGPHLRHQQSRAPVEGSPGLIRPIPSKETSVKAEGHPKLNNVCFVDVATGKKLKGIRFSALPLPSHHWAGEEGGPSSRRLLPRPSPRRRDGQTEHCLPHRRRSRLRGSRQLRAGADPHAATRRVRHRGDAFHPALCGRGFLPSLALRPLHRQAHRTGLHPRQQSGPNRRPFPGAGPTARRTSHAPTALA